MLMHTHTCYIFIYILHIHMHLILDVFFFSFFKCSIYLLPASAFPLHFHLHFIYLALVHEQLCPLAAYNEVTAMPHPDVTNKVPPCPAFCLAQKE